MMTTILVLFAYAMINTFLLWIFFLIRGRRGGSMI